MAEQTKEGPDRGWSWVIAFAACFTSLVLAGIFRTSGVFFVAFINEFGVTREEASWPVVLCISVLNLTGIITGPLGQRFGVRPVAFVGSLVATIGVSSCYFATSLRDITICFGVVFGVGYGLTTNLIPAIVNEYFLNHRATANGIANSGSCFGSVILPPLFEFFLGKYGLSGCFLLTGGIVLQLAISSALMRPPPWLQKSKITSQVTSRNDCPNLKNATGIKAGTAGGYDDVVKSIRNRNAQLTLSGSGANAEELEYTSGKNESRQIFYQVETKENDEKNVNTIHLATENRKFSDKNTDETDLDKSLKDLDELLENFEDVFSSVQSSTEYKSNDNRLGDDSTSKFEVENFNRKTNENSLLQNTKEVFINSKVENIQNKPENANVNESENMHSANRNQNSNTDTMTPSSLSEGFPTRNYVSTVFAENTNKIICGTEQKDELDTNTKSIVLRSFKKVLTSPMFYVTATTNVSFYFLYHMYVVIIVDFSLDRGIPDKDTKYVLFAFAISDLFGRLCFGWITDQKFLRRSQYVMCCMTLIGLVFFCFPFASTYTGIIVVSSLYGLLLGCTMVLFPILLVDFLGIEVHGIAYGCMCFMNGLITFLRPFLIGYFRDNLGSYSNIFYVLGGISLVASLLWLLEYYFVKNKKIYEEVPSV